jgi:hypothetical protein
MANCVVLIVFVVPRNFHFFLSLFDFSVCPIILKEG